MGYDGEESMRVKDSRGGVGELVEMEQSTESIGWESQPPGCGQVCANVPEV